eukprot:s1678_g4.t1
MEGPQKFATPGPAISYSDSKPDPGVVKGMASDRCTGQVPRGIRCVTNSCRVPLHRVPRAGDGWCWAKSCVFDRKIVMVGLDAAGKTTVLYQLKLQEVLMTIPTIGFNVETVEYRNIRFTVWDIGGQDKIRSLWKHYFLGAHGVPWRMAGSKGEDGNAKSVPRMMLARKEVQLVISAYL